MGDIKDSLVNIISENAPHAAIANDTSFDKALSDIGIDSLEIMTILLAMEEKYNLKIPEDKIDDLTTLNAIVKYFQNQTSNNQSLLS